MVMRFSIVARISNLYYTIFIVYRCRRKGNGAVWGFRSPGIFVRMRLFYDHGFLKRGDVLLCLKCSDLDLIHILA